MDCKTARLLLEFARPPDCRELEPLDRGEVEAHLAGCPDCAAAARSRRHEDEQFGRAMRAVEVPDRLRARLLARLADERAANNKRRWKAAAIGALAAAAMLLLAVGLWALYHQVALKPFNVEKFVAKVNEDGIIGRDRQSVEAKYREQGVEMSAPGAFDYAYLMHFGMAELQSRQVPCLIFLRDEDNDAANIHIHAHAKVYVLSANEFNLKDLPAGYESEGGYRYKVEVQHEPGSRYAYVIVHTGESLDWLRTRED
jgi:hypothetical protein